MSRKTFLFSSQLLIIFLYFHIIRDTLQMVNLNFWLTNIGHHTGVKVSNFFLRPLHLNYQPWLEKVFIPIEILAIYLIKRYRTAKLPTNS